MKALLEEWKNEGDCGKWVGLGLVDKERSEGQSISFWEWYSKGYIEKLRHGWLMCRNKAQEGDGKVSLILLYFWLCLHMGWADNHGVRQGPGWEAKLTDAWLLLTVEHCPCKMRLSLYETIHSNERPEVCDEEHWGIFLQAWLCEYMFLDQLPLPGSSRGPDEIKIKAEWNLQ